MNEMPRIWRSPYSDFGKLLKIPNDLQDETVTAVNVYTDEVLAKIAKSGFNAIWVHGLLRNLVRSDVFPGFGKNSKLHIGNMNVLIRRAAKHGLKVFIYMQPPRGFNVEDKFWKNHIDVGGAKIHFISDDGYNVVMRALCTSAQKVKDFLRGSSERLIQELPNLGGVILITASEYPSHCYSRYNYIHRRPRPGNMHEYDCHPMPLDCPYCIKRHPREVVCEIIHLIRKGVRAVSQKTQIIVWNWSWTMYEQDPNPTIIKNLPKDIILICDFERGDTKLILDKIRPIDEYSISFIGPSKRFLDSYHIAKKYGLRIIAKLQIGTTHELATVPNLPLISNLYEKARQMRILKIEGFMGCWNFGNMLTSNTRAFNSFFHRDKLGPKQKVLTEFASTYFPGCCSKMVVQAWERFGMAMDSYPFSIPFLYWSPINYSLAYPLKYGQLVKTPIGRSWQIDKRGDELEKTLDGYSLTEVITGLRLVAKQWKSGLSLLESALRDSNCIEARQELNNAQCCYHIFRSVWNTYRVYRLRRKWSDSKLSAYFCIIKDEIRNLEAVLPIVQADNRLGYHSEAQAYMFDVASIRKKITLLKKQFHGS